jgi:hypothetical protein
MRHSAIPRAVRPLAFAAAGALLLGNVADVRAQEGAGSTGAAVLQLLAGGRAAALSGAYTAATGDSDVLFYNPAGIGMLASAAGISYQRHVEDIGLATASGAFGLGRLVVGASAMFLDYGEIAELEPDPAFGGQTGVPTGNQVGASEVAGRIAAALPLMDDRLRLGAAVGLVAVDLAGVSRSTPLVDAGAQLSLPFVTLGAAIRNAGGALSGEALADSDLPTEARLGAMLAISGESRLGATIAADVVSRLNEGETGVVAGFEAGLIPAGANRMGVVGRVGYNGTSGDEGLGTFQLGAGLSFGNFALDYAYQSYDMFGSLHRFGVRWARLR